MTTQNLVISLAKEKESAEITPMHSGQCVKSAIYHANTTLVTQMGFMVGTELKSKRSGIGLMSHGWTLNQSIKNTI